MTNYPTGSWIAGVFGVLILFAVHGTWAQDGHDNLATGIETCKQTFADADSAGDSLDGLLDNIENLLEPEDPAQSDPSEIAMNLVKGGQTSLPDRAVIKQARQARQWIKAYQQRGEQELRAAEQAKDPTVARVHLKAALIEADKVRNITQRLMSAVIPSAGTSNETTLELQNRGLIGLNDRGSIFGRLKEMVEMTGKGVDKPTGAALGEVYKAWEGVKEPPPTYREGSKFFRGNYDPEQQQINLETGDNIDLDSLNRALEQVAPEAVREPLFIEPPSPLENSSRLQLNPEALRALNNPQTRDALRKVGGVELDVTFDVLSFAGVSQISSRPATVVESPVLISLLNLYERLKPYAASTTRWGNLPEELRYPGEIERLHGYVLSPDTRDVVLIGAAAQSPNSRMDVDALIIGLRSVWAEGKTPSVSLDPLPNDRGGPQYARVYDVAPDSTFALIMLEADYAMKRILSGHMTVNAPGYVSEAEIIRRERPLGMAGDRFWLHPTPLGRNQIHQSTTNRTVLVDSGVQVLTESQKLSGVGAVRAEKVSYSGTTGNIARRSAENFTQYFDQFERAPDIRPSGIFMRLHGLVDIVTLSKFWRRAGLDYSILSRFSRLPVRQLAVPAHYAGVTVYLYDEVVEKTETLDVIKHTLSGGVAMRTRTSGQAVNSYGDTVTGSLESEADSFARNRAFLLPLSLTFAVPRAGGEAATSLSQSFELGMSNLGRGNFSAARMQFIEVTRLDPFLTDAWVKLAIAESFLGNHVAAKVAVEQALFQEPANSDIRRVAISIYALADPAADFADWDEAARREVSGEYALAGLLAWFRSDDEFVAKAAEMALALWEDNPDGYFLRAQIREPLSRGWTRDLDRAVRLYRRQLEQNEGASQRLALMLAWRAQKQRIDLGLRTDDRILTNPPAVQLLMEVADRAARDAAEAAELSPKLGLAPTVEVELLTWRVGMRKAMGNSWDMTDILALADSLVQKFPDFAPGHRARAYALGHVNDLPAAIQSMSKAIDLDPGLDGALSERAGLYVMMGKCAEARSDLDRARSLDIFVHEKIEAIVRKCQ